MTSYANRAEVFPKTGIVARCDYCDMVGSITCWVRWARYTPLFDRQNPYGWQALCEDCADDIADID